MIVVSVMTMDSGRSNDKRFRLICRLNDSYYTFFNKKVMLVKIKLSCV